MITLFEFIARLDIFFYALSAVGIFFSIRGLVQARRQMRNAVFGLEREAARRRRSNAASTIITLLLLSGAVYIIANIVVPNLGEEQAQPTPTPVVFVTAEPSATPMLLLFSTITPTIGLPPSEAELTNVPPAAAETTNGCEIIGTTITSPEPDAQVSGQVLVEGQANILNFSQYKFELYGSGTGGQWVVVGTFTVPVTDGILGSWDSTSLPAGSYRLRLVVLRADGTFPSPCEIPITVLGVSG
jgi:hypothetical protein